MNIYDVILAPPPSPPRMKALDAMLPTWRVGRKAWCQRTKRTVCKNFRLDQRDDTCWQEANRGKGASTRLKAGISWPLKPLQGIEITERKKGNVVCILAI